MALRDKACSGEASSGLLPVLGRAALGWGSSDVDISGSGWQLQKEAKFPQEKRKQAVFSRHGKWIVFKTCFLLLEKSHRKHMIPSDSSRLGA